MLFNVLLFNLWCSMCCCLISCCLIYEAVLELCILVLFGLYNPNLNEYYSDYKIQITPEFGLWHFGRFLVWSMLILGVFN